MAVALGSALGAMARFWLADTITRRLGERFPWGTLAVNASGALLVGIVAASLLGDSAGGLASTVWHFGVLGLIGSYTTVSSFSLQTLALIHESAWDRAAANVFLSFVLCFSAVGAGFLAGGLLGRS